MALLLLAAVAVAVGIGAVVRQQVARESSPAWNQPSSHPDRIILTWAADPATTQSVTWRTDTTVARGRAEVVRSARGPDFAGGAISGAAATETLDALHVERAELKVNYHSVTFAGLEPGTLYAYRVGSDDDWSEWLQFRTASAAPEPFSFLYFGDAQNEILTHWSRSVRAAYARAPDARFMVHAGDLVNRAHSDREWGEWFRAGSHVVAMIPSLPAPGNHEYAGYSTADGEQVRPPLSVFWRAQFTLPENGAPAVSPESNYYVDYQGLRVLAMNSSEDLDAQARWLEAMLPGRSARWTIALHHHPVFSSAGSRDNDELREAWQPVYERHGVDLVLQGHDHTYARGHTGPPIAATIVYVNSVAGPKMYDFKPGLWDMYDAQLDQGAERTQLFQVIEVNGDTLSFSAYTVTGELFDAFDLVKREGRPNLLIEKGPTG